MPTPRFNLKNLNEDVTLISLVFRYKRLGRSERMVYSTQIKVPPKCWNFEKQRIKKVPTFTQGPHINALLNKIRNHCESIYYQYSLGKIKELSVEQFKKELDNALGRATIRNITLEDYCQKYIDQLKKKDNNSYKPYQTDLNRLKDYMTYCRRVIDFEDINLRFMEDYRDYLFEEMNLGSNTVHKVFSRLKTILRRAYDQKMHANSDFDSSLFKINKVATDSTYLSMDELKLLYHTSFDDSKHERIRDVFVLACFIGARVSDWPKVAPQNFHVKDNIQILRLTTKKTGQNVAIPVHPVVRAILEKYDYALPQYSDVHINRTVKECCRIAGLNQAIGKKQSKGGIIKKASYEKWQLITTHTARRSFATNAYLAGIDPVDICKITGHKKISQLLDYIKASDLQSAVKVSKNVFFSGDGFLRAV